MEKEYNLFEEIEIRGNPIKLCELVYEGRKRNSRMYIHRNESQFYAHAVRWVEAEPSEGIDIWDSNGLVVETLFKATAYFDGVRHLEFNRNGGEMDGYIYYPDMYDLVEMLKILRKLELEICRYAE